MSIAWVTISCRSKRNASRTDCIRETVPQTSFGGLEELRAEMLEEMIQAPTPGSWPAWPSAEPDQAVWSMPSVDRASIKSGSPNPSVKVA
jgi:hypothetical protein